MAQTLAPVTRRRRLARLSTEVLAPAVLVVVLDFVVAWHARPGWAGLGWGALAALFTSVIPFMYVLRKVRTGEVTDHHIGDRRQRRGPLLFGLSCVIAGVGLLVLLGAPRELLAVIAATIPGLLVVVAVSQWWKVSIHGAVAGGSAAILLVVFGPLLLLAWPLVALVGWSRVELRDHTVLQVLIGVAIGAAIAAGMFVALR